MMEFLREYKDIDFAVVWCDQEPTTEEMGKLAEELEVSDEIILSLKDYVDELDKWIESDCPNWAQYVDIARVLRDQVVNGVIDIVKVDSGYAVITYQ